MIPPVVIADHYKVAIRDNQTGETKVVEQAIEWFSHSHFFWTDGNFGCDCNRHDVFYGHSEEEDEDEIPCGHERFTVLYAELPSGERITIDEEKHDAED